MKPVSILIVDDRAADRYLLSRDLQRIGLGVHVSEAVDGREALDFLTEFDENSAKLGDYFPPTIIFLDINMPGMNGFEFLEGFAELREKRSDYRAVIVLMFSSSEHPDEHQRALQKEFVADFVVKGATSTEELQEKVNRALQLVGS